MARAGRKRVEGRREANGRAQRVNLMLKVDSPGVIRRLITAAKADMCKAEWGSPLGILYMQEKIDPKEYGAGMRWANLASLYRRLQGVPGLDPRPNEIGRIRASEPDPDSEAGRKEARIAADIAETYKEARTILCDTDSLFDVHMLCERHQYPVGHEQLLRTKCGLSALATHWRLTNP